MANPGSIKVTFASWLQIVSAKTVTECMVKRVLKEADVNITLEEFMYSLVRESRVVVSKMPHEDLRAHLKRHRHNSKKRHQTYSEKRRRRRPRRSASPASAPSTSSNTRKVQPSLTTRRSKKNKKIEERMKELFGSVTPPPEPIQRHPTYLSNSSNNITMGKEVETSGPITSQIMFVDSNSDDDEDDIIFVESVDSTNNNLFVTKDGNHKKESDVYEKPCPKSRKRNNVIILGNKRKRCTETKNNVAEEVKAHMHGWNIKTSRQTNEPSTEVNSTKYHAITSGQKRDHIPQKVSTVSSKLSVDALSLHSMAETKLDSNKKGELLANRISNNSELVHDVENICKPKVHFGNAIISDKLFIEETKETTHDIKRVKIEIDTKDKALLENNLADDQITTPTNNLKEIDNAFSNMNCQTDKPLSTLNDAVKSIPKISVKPIESMLSQSNCDNNGTMMNIKNWESVIPTSDIPNIIPPTVEQPKKIKIPPAVQSPSFKTRLQTEDGVVNPCGTQQTSKSTTVHPNNHNVDSRTDNKMQTKNLAEYIVRLMEERKKYKQSIAEAKKYSNDVIKNEMLKTARTLLKHCEKFILQESSPYFHPKYLSCFQNMQYLQYLNWCAKNIANKTQTEPFNDILYTETLMHMCTENYKIYANPKNFEKAPTGDTDVRLASTQHSETYNQILSNINNANKNQAKAPTGDTDVPLASTQYSETYNLHLSHINNANKNGAKAPTGDTNVPLASTQYSETYNQHLSHINNANKNRAKVPTGDTNVPLASTQYSETYNQHLSYKNNANKNRAQIKAYNGKVTNNNAALLYVPSLPQTKPPSSVNALPVYRAPPPPYDPLDERLIKVYQNVQTYFGGTERGTSLTAHYENQTPIQHQHITANWPSNVALRQTNPCRNIPLNQQSFAIEGTKHMRPRLPTSVLRQQYRSNAGIWNTSSNQSPTNRSHLPGEVINQMSQLNQDLGASIQGSQHIQHPYPSTSVSSNSQFLNTNSSNQNPANRSHLPGVVINQMSQLNQDLGASIQGSQHIQHPYPSTSVSSNSQFLNTYSSNLNPANRSHLPGEVMKQMSQLNQDLGASIQGSQNIQHPYPSTSVSSNSQFINTNSSNLNPANRSHLPGEVINQMSQLNQDLGASLQGSQHIQHPYPSTSVSSNLQFLNTNSSNQNEVIKRYLMTEPHENSMVYQQYQTPNATDNLQGVARTTNSNATWNLKNKPQNQSAVDHQHYYYQNSEMLQLGRMAGANISSDGSHSQTTPAPVLLDQVQTSNHVRSQSRDSGFMSPTDTATSLAIETLVTSGTSLMARGQCKICNMTTILKCTGCYDVYYCSNRCQVNDWPQHSSQCIPVEE